uniref:Uncharacterized protein n=1 Tax=Setaria italica TaxID=4555 RepID=K3XQ71_SETIT
LFHNEVPALAHGGEDLVVLEHGDDVCEVPDDIDVDESYEVGDDEEECEELEEDDDEHRVLREEEREDREERRREPPPCSGHDGEHPRDGECVVLGGVDGGDGEDGGGGGEEEEGEEVGVLEEEEGEPVGCEAGEEAALGIGARGGGVEGGVVGVDVSEEGVGDGDMEEEEGGEESGRTKAVATRGKEGPVWATEDRYGAHDASAPSSIPTDQSIVARCPSSARAPLASPSATADPLAIH